MLDSSLIFLRDDINAYINLKTGVADTLEITPLTNNQGQITSDKLGLTLVNIEEDRTSQPLPQLKPTAVGTILKSNPETKLNLILLFSANFENNYDEALKHLAFIITYFQARYVFTPASHPALPPGIEKLILEMRTLSLEQQNNLWASLGAKYRPSVVFKMRMLLLEDSLPLDAKTPITEISKSYL